MLLDVEDQVCEGPKCVAELHEVAFEVAADDMLSPDQCHLPGERTQFTPALLVEGERELVVVGEVPLVEQCLPFGEVVEPTEDRLQHRQGSDLRIRGLGRTHRTVAA